MLRDGDALQALSDNVESARQARRGLRPRLCLEHACMRIALNWRKAATPWAARWRSIQKWRNGFTIEFASASDWALSP